MNSTQSNTTSYNIKLNPKRDTHSLKISLIPTTVFLLISYYEGLIVTPMIASF